MANGDRFFGPNGAVGEVTGTGASIAIRLDFKPIRVKLVNATGLATLEWTDGMADAAGLKEVTDGTKSFIVANGITPRNSGFYIGTNGDLNVLAETIYWQAERSFRN